MVIHPRVSAREGACLEAFLRGEGRSPQVFHNIRVPMSVESVSGRVAPVL